MADIADQAQAAEALERAAALSAALDRGPDHAQIRRNGAVICRECFEPIDPVRLLALPSACRCAECQTDFDKGRG